MGKCFIEQRKPTVRGSGSGAADMMRHLRTRQHLGSALVICERPDMLLATARKQWMKLSRGVQKQRAMTLNADKILKFTHIIIHMQNMRFTCWAPQEAPENDAYFITPSEATLAPSQCYTVYLQTGMDARVAQYIVRQLPDEALVVDYTHQPFWPDIGLLPKQLLEENVHAGWRHIRRFLRARSIDITRLHLPRHSHLEALDTALDILLEVPRPFLQAASEFRRTLELARPLRVSKELRQQYDVLMLLAHRVQALTMPAYSQLFLESYSEDDTFFLYDRRRRAGNGGETLGEAVARHRAAGRMRLAASLISARWGVPSSPNDNRLPWKSHARQAIARPTKGIVLP